MNTKSVQNINIHFVQKLWVNILICWVIEWSNSGMSHRCNFRNSPHRVWAKWDLSNNDSFLIIPDPGCQKRITLSWESISRILFQARTSYVKIPEWGQHSSNRRMPCLLSIFGTFQVIRDQLNENPGALCRCTAHIFSNITNCGIQWPGMLFTWTIARLSLVGCTNYWHNWCSGRMQIL